MNQQGASDWPALPLDDWQDTYATLHLWAQMVGKLRLALSEWINHYCHITLYPVERSICRTMSAWKAIPTNRAAAGSPSTYEATA